MEGRLCHHDQVHCPICGLAAGAWRPSNHVGCLGPPMSAARLSFSSSPVSNFMHVCWCLRQYMYMYAASQPESYLMPKLVMMEERCTAVAVEKPMMLRQAAAASFGAHSLFCLSGRVRGNPPCCVLARVPFGARPNAGN